MHEIAGIEQQLQFRPLWVALVAGFVPALIAGRKRRPMLLWYLYGFACALVTWPAVALPAIHALVVKPRGVPEPISQRRRRADALALAADGSVRAYPSWIAELR